VTFVIYRRDLATKAVRAVAVTGRAGLHFAKVAEACGAHGHTIEDPAPVEDVLRRALQEDAPR
jgi:thiamine pyrophosphate-dependent acetolactate synthase large subunit-like protein